MLHIKLEEKIKIIINMKDSLEQSCSRLFKKRHSLIKDYVVFKAITTLF